MIEIFTANGAAIQGYLLSVCKRRHAFRKQVRQICKMEHTKTKSVMNAVSTITSLSLSRTAIKKRWMEQKQTNFKVRLERGRI